MTPCLCVCILYISNNSECNVTSQHESDIRRVYIESFTSNGQAYSTHSLFMHRVSSIAIDFSHGRRLFE